MEAHKKLRCCNPFNECNHTVSRNLRPVLPWMIKINSSLSTKYKICDRCRKTFYSLKSEEENLSSSENDLEYKTDEEIASTSAEVALSSLNESLQAIGETPVKKKRLQEKRYPKAKQKKIQTAMRKKIFLESDTDDKSVPDEAESEIVAQLKEKFNTSTKRSEKIQILTVLPLSWSIRRIQEEFDAPNYMVRRAKELVKQHGILTTPNSKPGKILEKKVADLVINFYLNDDISRCLPGKKDFVSFKENGMRVRKQKRLILNNLKDIYNFFKEQHPDLKIGFTKFCELRPKNCVLPGASGTHVVCVCTIHQNVKLMLLGAKLKELTRNENMPVTSYQNCLSKIICDEPQTDCYFGSCLNCPGTSELEGYLHEIFDKNGVDEISYKQWIVTDRTSLEYVTKTSDDFVNTLIEKLNILLEHSFIATEQSNFQNHLKTNLKHGEILVICDFAENYSFVLQDEAQGYHWNNNQATLHPFVAYFRNNDGNISHVSFVVVSDCLEHNTTAVHLFQRYLIEFLREQFNSNPKHIFYFSDGSAAQYKNRKNFINICYHQEDFGITAEWHFYATSHGKGVCDGISGTIKRLATRASLQRPYMSQIMTPFQLYEWAKENIQACNFVYLTVRDYEEEDLVLSKRYSTARRIPGTRKFHAYKPVDKNKIQVKVFSNSTNSKIELVSQATQEIELCDIKGYVTCRYEDKWWVGCVLNVSEETDEVKISFLHPNGPSTSYRFPEKSDILSVPKCDIYEVVDVRSATGRTYILSAEDTNKTNHKHQVHK